MSSLGTILQILALVATIPAMVTLMASVAVSRRGRAQQASTLANVGFLLVFANTLLLTLCVGIILVCFLTENMTLSYVAMNFPETDSALKPLYQVAGVWAGRQGSLLFWTWLISLFAAATAWRRMRQTDALTCAALAVVEVVIMLFTCAMVLSDANNAFIATPAQYLNADGTLVAGASTGMNPLLLHWAMVLHPPATFIGYAGCAVPFAYAIAALITGDLSARWVEHADRVAVFSFIFLTIGMVLGAVWAYVVLGWGGFWAWDAVENASFMSWLTAIAMIHSFTLYRRRGVFRRWSLFVATITFIFVVLGTFITRSGLVQSVHAFAEDPVSTYFFLGIMISAGLAFLLLMLYRSAALTEEDEIESLASKNGSYYLTNLVCVVGACLVAYLTVSSALPSWLPLGGQVVSAGVYNAVARPATALFGLLMAVCPLLGWRKTDGAAFWRNFRVPLIVGAVVFVALEVFFFVDLVPAYDATVAAGGDAAATLAEQGPRLYYLAVAEVSLVAAALLFASSAYLLGRGVRSRASRGENPAQAVVNLFRHSPAQAGGYLAHLGCAIALVGLVGSGMFVQEQTVNLAAEEGTHATVAGYALTVTGIEDTFDAEDDRVMTIELAVGRAAADGEPDEAAGTIGTLTPAIEVSAATQQQTLHASVLTFPTEDLFVAFQGLNADGSLSLSVKVNPLILCNWIGGVLCIAGIVLAVVPRRATPLLAADERG